jgi:L-seryl-tRNA(Ser) seleniumtransferase
LDRTEWLRVGKGRGVPTFLVAAADVPPLSRFSEYLREGFDLVTFSGGKAIRGPQASGLLLGRTDLVEAGRRAISPRMGIGRGMKVGKEEIIGLLAAVERFVTLDHDAEWRTWEARTSHIIAELSKIPGVAARRDVPEIANHFPQVVVEWSQWHAAPASGEVVRRLWDGDPRIAVLPEGSHGLRIVVFTLRDDEHILVAKHVREVLEGR